jgi:16S rRNA (guanine527-N7)-methyltransferase
MEIVKKYFTDFTPQQEQQLAALKELYNNWNQKINVISRKDMDNFYMHHVLHSLAITTQFNFKKICRSWTSVVAVDFPVFHLAIFFPGHPVSYGG